MMKRNMRIFAAAGLMALLLLAACVPGMAQEECAVTQSVCSIVRSGNNYEVYCFAQIRNNSDKVVCLDEGTLELHNDDQLLASQWVGQIWPYFLSPGEEGYLFDVVTFEPNEDGIVVPSVTALNYDLKYMEIDPAYAGQRLETNVRLETEGDGCRVTLICEVKNAGQEEVYHPTISYGLYSDAGQLLYTGGTTLYDVGIPAGGTVLARFDVDRVFADQWSSYGVTPSQAAVHAMYRSEAD